MIIDLENAVREQRLHAQDVRFYTRLLIKQYPDNPICKSLKDAAMGVEVSGNKLLAIMARMVEQFTVIQLLPVERAKLQERINAL